MTDPDPAWKASGWLGLLTAGALWTTISNDHIEQSCDNILAAIKTAAMVDLPTDSGSLRSTAEIATPTQFEDAKAELARLRSDLEAAKMRRKPVDFSQPMFDSNQPAIIPTLTPQLPRDFRETPAIQELRRLLLSPPASLSAHSHVGFWGMGGCCPSGSRSCRATRP